MGQSSRRRKGKSSSRSSTPTLPSWNDGSSTSVDGNTNNANSTETNLVSSKKAGEGMIDNNGDSSLVLTSEKRRGIYECDYCHSDISQQPRIRCAVCSDFDLCLDCFTTTDHRAMMARIKAATQTQTELNKDGIDATSIVGVAISSAAAHHEDHHCYKVCDSTRYPIFPPGRIQPPKTTHTEETAAKINAGTLEQDKPIDYVDPKALSTSDDNSPSTATRSNQSFDVPLSEDPKTTWTAEEDLRLIDAIATHGLGNWVDISEAIGGQGSFGKTPKRCMERYLDDYLGRFGHILPQWTIVDETMEEGMIIPTAEPQVMEPKENDSSDSRDKPTENLTNIQHDNSGDTHESTPGISNKNQADTTEPIPSSLNTADQEGAAGALENPTTESTTSSRNASQNRSIVEEEERVRTSKRRSTAANVSASRKKVRVVPTECFPGYNSIWPKPYIPSIPGGVMGREVARDQSCKAELAFVKATMAASTKEEADKIRQNWIDTRLGAIGSPTVLPPRPHDAVHLLGSELAGFMPRRGDFDVEWENDAEAALADMEFLRGDRPEDKELKLKVLQIYCEKLDEREKRKKFVLNRHLYDYRTYVQNDSKLPMDERDLVHRMRLFERFHTPEEHSQFIKDILKAKRLRKEIAKLQMYRRIGIRSLAEAETYELDKERRQFHKKLEMETKAKSLASAKAAAAAKGGSKVTTAIATGPSSLTSRVPSQFNGTTTTDSLWKQYRTNDRNKRRSSGRSSGSISKEEDGTKASVGIATTQNHDFAPEGEEAKSESTPKGSIREESQEKNTTVEVVDTVQEPNTKMDASTTSGRDGTKNDGGPNGIPQKGDGDRMQIDTAHNESNDEVFDLSNARCRDLLSKKELALCQRLRVYPVSYLELKKTLIRESLESGLLDKDANKRTIVKIDVERRGNIVDFLVRAGWINRKVGEAAVRVVTPQPP